MSRNLSYSTGNVDRSFQDIYKLFIEAFDEIDKIKLAISNGEFNKITVNDLEFIKSFKPRIYRQSAEPGILDNSVGFWIDTDDNKNYIIMNIEGTQKKIELT